MDCSLCNLTSMVAQRYKLGLHLVLFNGILESSRSFVVEHVLGWAYAALVQLVNYFLVRPDHVTFCSVLHHFG